MTSVPPTTSGLQSLQGEPAWEIAHLYPPQGQWSELDYLEVSDGTNWLVELTDGHLEVLAMPTSSHQRMMLFLLAQIQAYILPLKLGEALCAPLRLRVREGMFREPDVIYASRQNQSFIQEEFWHGADLVIEIVSPDKKSRKRDHETKVLDYAEAKIPEYWIVDPQQKQITVLTLAGDKYEAHGSFEEGQTACSKLLTDFSVEVSAVFAAAKG